MAVIPIRKGSQPHEKWKDKVFSPIVLTSVIHKAARIKRVLIRQTEAVIITPHFLSRNIKYAARGTTINNVIANAEISNQLQKPFAIVKLLNTGAMVAILLFNTANGENRNTARDITPRNPNN